MKNKGFTLIELLAVIVILSIIAIIAVPIVLNIIKDAKSESDKRSLERYEKAIENAIVKYQLDSSGIPSDFSQLNIEYEGNVNCKIALLYDDSTFYLDQCYINNKYIEDYKSGVFKVKVDVPEELTPVIYNGTNWEIASEKSKWYNYDNQEWANAVILNSELNKKVGDIIDIEKEVKAMFVYIPKYEYKIEGAYGKGGTSLSNPGEIEINFIPKSQLQPSSSDYIVHPAFTFGEKDLEGIWVGKFETSYKDNLRPKLGCTDENCTNADNLRILPNVLSLDQNNHVSGLFYAIRSMSREGNGFVIKGDTHMIKNGEWGAVAYLSQSKYGKYGNSDYEGFNKEIYQNKSNIYTITTGLSNGTPSQEETLKQCVYNDLKDRGNGLGSCGGGASTTGNITGIYDMSGGSFEYVMGNLKNTFIGHEFTALPNEKYYDIYYTTDETKACDGAICYGQALSEISLPSVDNYNYEGWYNDESTFPFHTNVSWIVRGGNQNNSTSAGIFSYTAKSGFVNSGARGFTSRVVLVYEN